MLVSYMHIMMHTMIFKMLFQEKFINCKTNLLKFLLNISGLCLKFSDNDLYVFAGPRNSSIKSKSSLTDNPIVNSKTRVSRLDPLSALNAVLILIKNKNVGVAEFLMDRRSGEKSSQQLLWCDDVGASSCVCGDVLCACD
mgnify:CR=1 FL=1